MFESARLKLTAWYLAIIMAICLFFSVAIYVSITSEFTRFKKFHIKVQEDMSHSPLFPHPPQDFLFRVEALDPQYIENANRRVIANLVLINLIILIVSGAAGYFLAGRTLRPIQKMVDEQKRFTSDASHEFRTPITSLRSEIEVALRNKKLSLQDVRALLKSNLEEVISLQRLSDSLLELAQYGRITNHKYFQKVFLQDVIEKAYKKVEPLAKKKQITVSYDIKNYEIEGIPDRLQEIFIILFDNAIKYSPKNTKVTVLARKKRKSVTVLVQDQGFGIAREHIPHIFDRFYRASKSRTKTIAGYGLGLAIAKKIITMHGGRIAVKSDGKNGSLFLITLPLLSS